MEYVVKQVKNGFVIEDTSLGEEFVFTRQHQVIKFLKEKFAEEAAANESN